MLRVSSSAAVKHLKTKVTPSYPRSANHDHVQGTVILAVVIGTDGSVNDIKVVSAPREDLADVAVEAVKQWKYEPFFLKGEAITTETRVNVNFELRP